MDLQDRPKAPVDRSKTYQTIQPTQQEEVTPERKDFKIEEVPQMYYNKSLRQSGLKNENQLKYLHDKFDEIS